MDCTQNDTSRRDIDHSTAALCSSLPPVPQTPLRALGMASTLVFTAALAALLPGVASAAKVAIPQPTREICDGIDNNNNGQIDEGFDQDGDGVARCCERDRPFFTIRNAPQTEIHVYESFGGSSFQQSPAPAATVPTGQRLAVNAVGDFTSDGLFDILWTEVATHQRYLTVCSREWVSKPVGGWEFRYWGGADNNLDGELDVDGWDLRSSPVTGPLLGSSPFLGVTAFGAGSGTFVETLSTWEPDGSLGEWGIARSYNAEDLDGDALPDRLHWDYENGGASTTRLFASLGNGGGYGPPVAVGAVASQPQNYGDLGRIDNDPCTDWVGGSDDDGNRGAVFAALGDCAGNFGTPFQLVDNCVGCPGSGSGHGSGASQLYDWDGDGDLDLLTSYWVNTGATTTVFYWENNGAGSFSGPTAVISAGGFVTTFETPLRN